MRILLTGGTGFIGSALCQELYSNGHSVTAIVRPDSLKKDKIPNGVDVIELPLENICELSGNYDICYHLAWNGSSGNARNNFDVQMTNIRFSADVMRTAKKLGCKKFIGAGSQAEYGIVHGLCTEETLPNPFMMYGAAKLSVYNMCRILAEQIDISFVWPRIYSVYGVGENDGTLLSYLIYCLKNNITAELSMCENMWDFIYITDCVKALRMLGEIPETSGVYNISSGHSDILKTFVEKVKEIVNPEGNIVFGGKLTTNDKTFWLEPSVKRLADLGFKSEVEFEEGIIRKVNFYG